MNLIMHAGGFYAVHRRLHLRSHSYDFDTVSHIQVGLDGFTKKQSRLA